MPVIKIKSNLRDYEAHIGPVYDFVKYLVGLEHKAEAGILKAVGFELLWLKNKRDYYKSISLEDENRIEELERRYKHKIEQAGGHVQ